MIVDLLTWFFFAGLACFLVGTIAFDLGLKEGRRRETERWFSLIDEMRTEDIPKKPAR